MAQAVVRRGESDPNPFQKRVRDRLMELERDPFAAARLGGFSDRRFVYDITSLKKESIRGPNLFKLAKALDWTVNELLDGPGSTTEGSDPLPPAQPLTADSILRAPADVSETMLRALDGNRDVPVMGTAVGGDDGDFRLNGQVIDYALRPRGIAQRRGVFVVYLELYSMYPALRAGDPLFVDPHRGPLVGDDVLIELHGRNGEPGDAYVKRLVRRSASKVVVEQFNPAKEIAFDTAKIKHLYRIIPFAELVGG